MGDQPGKGKGQQPSPRNDPDLPRAFGRWPTNLARAMSMTAKVMTSLPATPAPSRLRARRATTGHCEGNERPSSKTPNSPQQADNRTHARATSSLNCAAKLGQHDCAHKCLNKGHKRHHIPIAASTKIPNPTSSPISVRITPYDTPCPPRLAVIHSGRPNPHRQTALSLLVTMYQLTHL
jgi:hypothetical protein